MIQDDIIEKYKDILKINRIEIPDYYIELVDNMLSELEKYIKSKEWTSIKVFSIYEKFDCLKVVMYAMDLKIGSIISKYEKLSIELKEKLKYG
jgi:hypothetical protein